MAKITIHKNNSETLTLTLKQDGSAYNIASGDSVKFCVKKSVVDSDTNAVITKTFTGDGTNVYTLTFSATDTNIACGVYKWDLKDITTNKTLCDYDDFVISEVVYNG